MRVPTLERRVEPIAGGVPTHVGAVPTADYGAVGRGAAAIGGAVDKAVDEQKKANAQYEEQKHQADIVAARNAATELESFDTSVMYGDSAGASTQGTKLAEAGDQGSSAADLGAAVAPAPTEPSPGFLSTKGMDAAANGENTFQALKKRRDELAGKLSNDNQRQLFLQHSDQTLADSRRRIEGHTAQQVDVAKEDSINAAADEAVRAAAVDPGNDELARNRIAGVVGPIHALNRGQEWADSETLKVQQRVASTRLDALLSSGNVDGAERVLDSNKWALGGQLDDYKRKVETARAGAEAEVVAGHLVSSATTERGEVNQAAVLARLNALPGDQQRRVRPIVFQRMTEQEQAFAADTKRISTAAFTTYNSVGWGAFAKTPLAAELNDRNPELYNRLQNEAQSDLDRLERKRRGTAEDHRAQTQIDNVALNQFLSLSPEDRSEADTESWAKGRGMSPVAVSSLGKLKEQAREVVTRGQATSEGEFVKRSVADAESTFDTGTSSQAKARRRMQVQEHEAKARRWFAQWVSEHEGHAPTDSEAADQSGKLALGRVPIGDEGAAQQAEVIVRRGTQKVRVLPELDFSGGSGGAPKLSKAERAKALKATGLSNADIAKKMTDEGY